MGNQWTTTGALMMVLGLATTAAAAANPAASALINEALDRQVQLDLNGVLPEILKQIARETGVAIEAEPAVWDLLPWGEQTSVTAKAQNQTLRQALTAISRKLGLTFILREQAVELQPCPALRRLGRRATVEELAILDLLAATPLDLDTNPIPGITLRKLLEAVDQRLVDLKTPYALEYRAGEGMLRDAVFVTRSANLMDALDSLAGGTKATWYPEGRNVLVVRKEDQVRAALDRRITMRFNGVAVGQVLVELAQKAGVNLTIEPGALQKVPAPFRTIQLALDNASFAMALENIAGFTGLGYVPNAEGVYIWNQSAYGPGAESGGEPILGMVPIPDLGIQVPLTASQVPPDVRDYLRFKAQKETEKLRQQMREEGFVPATQATTTVGPATRPDKPSANLPPAAVSPCRP